MSTTAGASASELKLLVDAWNGYLLGRQFWLASFCLLIYDSILTFPGEVRYFWGRKLSWMTFLFYLNRYWAVFGLMFDNIFLTQHNLPDDVCRFFFKWVSYTAGVGHFTIGAILITRTYALYNCNKYLLITLYTLLLTEIVVETIILTGAIEKYEIIHLPPPFTGCVPRGYTDGDYIYWLPMLIFESIMFLLSTYKLLELRFLRHGSGYNYVPHLATVLIRDSVVYFGGSLTMVLVNLLSWRVGPPNRFTAFLSWGFCVHSMLGCRMLINIRSEAEINIKFQQETSTLPFEALRMATVNNTTLCSEPGPSTLHSQDPKLEDQA